MKLGAGLLLAGMLFLMPSMARGGNVRMEYDHSVDFAKYHTYSWGNVQTSDPFYVSRIQHAVDHNLQAKGWRLVPKGGSTMIFATDNIHNQKEVQTMYDGRGGGWGGGWGCWSAGPGFGESTSVVNNQPV